LKFEIKNRFSGELIFTIETGSWRLAIEAAIKSNVDLSSANLLSADLSSADLRSANLSSADLRSADLLIYQFRKDWAYYTFDGMIRIGCEFHKVDTWLKDYRSIGEKNGYDKIEIEMYGKFIEMCAAHYQTLVE